MSARVPGANTCTQDEDVRWCELAGVVVVTAENPAFEKTVKLVGSELKLIVLPRDKIKGGGRSVAEQCRDAGGVVVRVKHMNHATTDAVRSANKNMVIIDNGRLETLLDALKRVHRGYEKKEGFERCQP